MDQKSSIKRLREIFCENGKNDGKYASVWLSEVDFGGWYHSDMLVLNIKAAYQIDSPLSEIDSVIKLLSEKSKEALQMIWRVAVYNANDRWEHCSKEDIMVYQQQELCYTNDG